MRLSVFFLCTTLFICPAYAQAESIQPQPAAPAEPGTSAENRQIGPWTYPVNPRGAQQLLPDISAIGAVAGAYFSEDPAGETGHDPARSGFTLQEIELAIQSVVDPYFRADIFIAFHEEEVELEEAYLTTLGLPKGLQAKAGKFLLPFGRQNQKHLETWHFIDVPLVNKYLLGPENLNEVGLELSYLFPLPFFLQLQATLSNGENETSFGGDRKEDLLYQGRLSASVDLAPTLTALLGGSAAFGFNDTADGERTDLYGGDLLLSWKPRQHRGVSWQTEYIQRRRETPLGLERDGGLYSYLDYQFLKRWHAGIRYDLMGLPEGARPDEWRLTPALTFNPTEFSRLRAQYEYHKMENTDAVHAGMMQLQFSIGPHGTHPF